MSGETGNGGPRRHRRFVAVEEWDTRPDLRIGGRQRVVGQFEFDPAWPRDTTGHLARRVDQADVNRRAPELRALAARTVTQKKILRDQESIAGS